MEYREKIKRQNILLWAALALSVVLNVVIGELASRYFLDSRQITPMAGSLQRILFFGFQIFLILRLAGNRKLLREREKCEEREREERDERRRFIGAAAGKLSADVFTVGLAVAVFAASFVDMSVFTPLAWVLLAWVGLRLAALFYERRKY